MPQEGALGADSILELVGAESRCGMFDADDRRLRCDDVAESELEDLVGAASVSGVATSGRGWN